MQANDDSMRHEPQDCVPWSDVTVEILLADPPDAVVEMLGEMMIGAEVIDEAFARPVEWIALHAERLAKEHATNVEGRVWLEGERERLVAAAAGLAVPPPPEVPAPMCCPVVEVAWPQRLLLDPEAVKAVYEDGWGAMRLRDFTHEQNAQAVLDWFAEQERLEAELARFCVEAEAAEQRFDKALAAVRAYNGQLGECAGALYLHAHDVRMAREAAEERALAPRRDLRLPIEAYHYTKRVGKSVVPVNHSASYVALLHRSGFEISYDVIQKEARVSIHGRPLPKSDHEGEVLLRRATDLCELNGLSTNGLQGTLTALMAGKQVNPVVDGLTTLEWDGKPRFDGLAEAVGATDTAAARAAFRIFLLQACAAADGGERGMGANREALPKYETVVVLQGEQGVGKTSGLRRLLPPWLRAYFQDGVTLVIGDKDSERQAVSAWISELGELEATFRRSEFERLKAFLSKREDRIRVAYGRTDSRFQRRTVFVASANSDKVLTDTTGNRRFAVLSVTTMNIGWSDQEIDQLWAEAWHRYCGGEQWWPTEDEKIALRGAAERFETASAVEERLVAKYDWERGMSGVRTVERLSVVQILDQLRPGTGGRDYTQAEVSNARETIRRLWRRHGAKLKKGVLCARVRDKWTPIYASGGKKTGFLLPPERDGGPLDAAGLL